jgi:hypothetical protein
MRARGRVSRVYLGGAAFLLAIQCLRTVVLNTQPWLDFMHWLAGLAS